jgi:lipopolysaccharide export system permease protein
MFKTYEKYLFSKFIKKFIQISVIFFSLVIVIGILEEISFFKDIEDKILLPYFLTLLNAPSNLFQIFPFIFFLTTQLFFFDLHNNDELDLIKKSGLKNTEIIKNLFFLSAFMGILIILIFYNISSTLKFYYLDTKNKLSLDNKYLAMVTKSGLWIKDEINGEKLIIKSEIMNKNILNNVLINKFDNEYILKQIIQSPTIDITNKKWIIYSPIVTTDNITKKQDDNLTLNTNFDYKKISNIFGDNSTLNFKKILNQFEDYKNLGYSTNEIFLHLLNILTLPLFYGVLTVMGSITMINFTKKKSFTFQITTGILISVILYYMLFIFNALGSTGKIPAYLAIFFPLIVISFISIVGLVRVNEK